MTKGHNKGHVNEVENKENRSQGQDKHLPDSKKNKSPHQGRNKEEDPSGGTKGKNNVP